MLEKVELRNFTVFGNVDLEFSPGVNLIIGENGTGKTHLLKLLYSVLESKRANPDSPFKIADKLQKVFLPRDGQIGRLVKRVNKSSNCETTITRNGKKLKIEFSSHAKDSLNDVKDSWKNGHGLSVYIPVKEMLANAPGFRSLYSHREIHFEEVYYDIVDRAFVPILKGPISEDRKKLLDMIQTIIKGKVVQKGEQFFLKSQQGELEFTLLAEGMRKFALLWLLIQNGTLLEGSTLFWDEPEANINPSMIQTLVKILLHLQAQGVQIFIATHSYVVLKEFDLQKSANNTVRFFALSKDEKAGDITCQSGDGYLSVIPNRIADAYDEIYNKEMARVLGE